MVWDLRTTEVNRNQSTRGPVNCPNYVNKAKKVDQRFHGVARHQVGPIERKLASLGDLQCLVLGQFGEASQHVHDLLHKLATLKAQSVGRAIGRPVSDQERASFLHSYRRHLSITAVRSQAQCLLARTGHLGQGAADAAARRKVVRETSDRNRKDMAAHFEAFVRGRRHHNIGGLHLH